jgi:hypothetical protein
MSKSIGKEFMKKTTYKFLGASDQQKEYLNHSLNLSMIERNR